MPISDAPQTQSQRRPPLLEFNDVNTYYGELHVLKSVNYRVGDGEIVCLLGGNASGKSTTMKTILGIVQAEERRRLPMRVNRSTACRRLNASSAASRPCRRRGVFFRA